MLAASLASGRPFAIAITLDSENASHYVKPLNVEIFSKSGAAPVVVFGRLVKFQCVTIWD